MVCCCLKSTTMAVASSSCIRPDISQPSLRCGNKGYVGRALSPSFVVVGKPNLNVEFHKRVYRSLQTRNGRPTRAVVTMMSLRFPSVTGIPKVTFKVPYEQSEYKVDIWTYMYQERIIFLGQYLDENSSNQMIGTMLYLDSVDDSKDLFLLISGAGGDLIPTISLYDTMQSLQCPVATHCMGYAYNMACFLVAAGDKGKRTAMPLSRFILQSPAGYARGQAVDVSRETNEMLRIGDYLCEELSQQTGQPVDKIREDISRIKRLSAEEAVEYGLIDRIKTPTPVTEDDVDEFNTGLF